MLYVLLEKEGAMNLNIIKLNTLIILKIMRFKQADEDAQWEKIFKIEHSEYTFGLKLFRTGFKEMH